MQHRYYKYLAVLAVSIFALQSAWAKPTRLILIVQEGLGHEILTAARLYSEEKELWDWRLDHNWKYTSLSTLPLTTKTSPDGSDPALFPEYNPLHSWNGTEVSLTPEDTNQTTFSGYKWLIENATDRNQAAMALGSGTPSFKTATNWLSYPAKSGTPLPPTQQLIEWANYHGMKTGIISDMPFSHATNTILAGARTEPDASAMERFNYVLESSPLDLYVSSGHPKYNALGQALSKPKYIFSSQNDWQDLRAKARSFDWNLIFGDENLMGISVQPGESAKRRLVVLQFGDTTATDAIAADGSGLSANLANSLRFQTKMGLDQLNQSEDGFVAIIHMGRLPYFLKNELHKQSVEEVINAFRSLIACEEWVEENGGWENTTLALLSTYEYGLIWGSNSSTYPFGQIKNRGKNQIPGFRINHNGPTASLTPFILRGSMAETTESAKGNNDPIYGNYLPIHKLGRLFKSFITSDQSKVDQD